ncbi:MAG: 4-oxalomesaconate tautomerase [Proteobacteria bacterium]|nr:4-oxalomesaconate tautomerase [Pseudomonadota bacterium]
MTQRAIPCMFMRGGTSRGPFFLLEDLPADPEVRDRVLLAAMGSPDPRQIDGLGGATTVTSKVAMVSPSQRPGIDVDYRFAQVWLDKAIVDTAPSCGNMLAGVGPFAIERGLVTPDADETRVRIFDVNTGSRIEAIVQTPGGTVTYAGDQRMDGVPGTAAPVVLSFSDLVGSKCGAMFPTGAVQEEIDGVAVSCIDVAVPMVMMRAGDLGLSGYDPGEITGNAVLMQRIENIRIEAGRRMGLSDVAETVVPKVGILSPPRREGVVYSRYLTPHHVHAAHAVTGAICVTCCASIKATVAHEVGPSPAEWVTEFSPAAVSTVYIEHPSGASKVRLETERSDVELKIQRAGIVLTARKIMEGRVYVPRRWPAATP